MIYTKAKDQTNKRTFISSPCRINLTPTVLHRVLIAMAGYIPGELDGATSTTLTLASMPGGTKINLFFFTFGKTLSVSSKLLAAGSRTYNSFSVGKYSGVERPGRDTRLDGLPNEVWSGVQRKSCFEVSFRHIVDHQSLFSLPLLASSC